MDQKDNKKKNKEVRAAIYVRVSSDEQVKGYSLSFQQEEIIEIIKKDGAILDRKHIYIDDGYTGINGDRPNLQMMITAAKQKEFDIVYVWKIDRLFRNTKLVLNLVDELITNGVGLKSILEPFCDSSNPIGRYMFTMMAAGAEMEHSNINERTQHGKLRAMKAGKWLGSAPYGYSVNEETKKLEINENEAKWVKKFFAWFVDSRLTLYRLQQKVNSLNISTKYDNVGRIKTKNGKCFWSRRTLGRMLTNELYTGVHIYRKHKYPGRIKNEIDLRPKEEWIEIGVPAIISKDIFEVVQKQLGLNKENSPRRTTRLYMFAKKLKCGVCGGKMHAYYVATKARKDGSEKEGYKYYGGSWLTKASTNERCENCIAYNETHLEKSIWEGIVNFLSNPKTMLRKLDRHRKADSNLDNIEEYQKELDKKELGLKIKEERLLNAYVEAEIDKELYKQKLSELGQQKKDVIEQRRKLSHLLLSNEEKLKRVISANALYKKLGKKLVNATYEGRCRIISLLIENITVTNGEGDVELNLPIKTFIPQFISQLNRPLVGVGSNDSLWDRERMDGA